MIKWFCDRQRLKPFRRGSGVMLRLQILDKGTVQNAIPYILGILLLWFAQSKRVSFSIRNFESWAMGRWGAGAGGRKASLSSLVCRLWNRF